MKFLAISTIILITVMGVFATIIVQNIGKINEKQNEIIETRYELTAITENFEYEKDDYFTLENDSIIHFEKENGGYKKTVLTVIDDEKTTYNFKEIENEYVIIKTYGDNSLISIEFHLNSDYKTRYSLDYTPAAKACWTLMCIHF